MRHTLIRFSFVLCALLASTALWAATDTDGDGIVDLAGVTRISAGSEHTCALDDNGVHCWGLNSDGQTTVPALTNPTAVSAGEYHTCALDDNGVHCWGRNSDGQTTVPALTNPTAVSAGYFHTCALDATGVVCWGRSSEGQTTVPALTNPTALSVAVFHTCALDDNGVHCWGDNFYGQTTVPALTNPTAVSARTYHTCALDDNGVHCWGYDYSGSTTVPALTNPTAVSAGSLHTCALDDNGVRCWGDSFYGQTPVPDLTNPTAVSAGSLHTCALNATGVVCWGYNSYGQTTVPMDLAALTPLDNCPLATNADQGDGDGDGLGDVCDPINDDSDNLNVVAGAVKAGKSGSVVAYAGDFNGDHFGDWAVGIPGYTVPADGSIKAIKGAGRVKIISGNDGAELAKIDGSLAGDGFGAALAGNADVNGDGLMDVVMGAPNADDPSDKKRKNVGVVRVIYGCKTGMGGCVATTSIPLYGSTPKTGFGTAVALGDVDEDDQADVVIGEPKATNDQVAKPLKQAGAVTVLSGADLNAPLLTVYGQTAGALAGAAVAAGDFNGAGGAEIIVGAPKDDNLTALPKPIKDTGSVKVYSNGDTTPIYTQYGAAAKDAFGQSVAANADVNKDGVKDVLVGAVGLDDPIDKKLKDVGGVVVLYGSNSAAYSRSTAKLGAEAKASLGASVALGDTNADGYVDLIASAPKGDNPTTLPKATKDTGTVAVFSGDGLTPLGSPQYGTMSKDYFGTSVSAGDINGDGKADIIVGIPGKDVMFEGKLQKDAGNAKVINATAL